jgi:hypothetical protein
VTDVKHDRVVTTREVLSHGAARVLKGHLPATEGDDFRAEFDVQVIEIGTAIQQDSLSGSTIHDTQVVLTKELMKVTLVYDEERELRIEITEAANLAVLLGRQTLFENRQLNEQATFGQIEVGTKTTNGHPVIVPVEGKLQGFIDPREAVEGQELREELFARVGEGLRNAGYHARMATTRVVAP